MGVASRLVVWIVCSASFACGGPSPRTNAIITGFKQGSAGNCTSLGFIKAVLHKYDGKLDGILKKDERTQDGGFRATTLGDVALVLSADEIRRGAVGAKLELLKSDEKSRSLRDSANLLFAVLGKACEMNCAARGSYCPVKEMGTCTFDNALKYLDSGLYWRIPPDLLGMKEGSDWNVIKGWIGGRWFKVTRFVSTDRSCVAATRKHTFFVGEGWADNYGEPSSFRSKIGSWFAFKSASAYCLGEKPAEVEMKEEAPCGTPPPEVLKDPVLLKIE